MGEQNAGYRRDFLRRLRDFRKRFVRASHRYAKSRFRSRTSLRALSQQAASYIKKARL